MRIKKADIILIVSILVFSVVLMFFQYNKTGSIAEIYVDGKLYGTYSLDSNKTIDVVSKFGTNKVEIHNGYVYVTEATCKDKNDIRQGKINKSGQSIICLPNRLIITVKGGKTYDALSY